MFTKTKTITLILRRKRQNILKTDTHKKFLLRRKPNLTYLKQTLKRRIFLISRILEHDMCCNLPQGRNSHVLKVTHGANKNGACVLARQAIHYFWAAQQQRILSQEIEQKRQEQNGPGQNGERYQSHIERHLFRFRYLWLVPYFDIWWYVHSRSQYITFYSMPRVSN